MELRLSDGCLVVFVDDTGHEALAEGHYVYGLGGCAVLAADLDRVIRQPWHEVRRKVTGSADTRLHAVSFARTAMQEQISIVAGFFRTQPFARLGATITVKSGLAENFGSVETIAAVLQKRIVDIARWTQFLEVCSSLNHRGERTARLSVHSEVSGLKKTECRSPLNVISCRRQRETPRLK